MRYKNLICSYCKSDTFYAIKRPDRQVGLYCAMCMRWQKWIPKREYKLIKVFDNWEEADAYGGIDFNEV